MTEVSHEHPSVDCYEEKARYRALALIQLEELGITDIDKRSRFESAVMPVDWEKQWCALN
jgi:phytoene desaturase